jgi:hypothetical protein
MLISEAIQDTQSLYSKGIQSKDTRLSTRHIYSELLKARTTVLKQQLNKKQRINEDCYQVIPCIELEEASIHECPIAPASQLVALRSKYVLPKIISSLDKLSIEYITTLDGLTRFDPTKFENAKYNDGNKYTGKKLKAYLKDGRLYLTAFSMLKVVTMKILGEDPIEVQNFINLCSDCTDCGCISVLDLDFHTDRDTFSSVSAIAKDRLIIMFGQMKRR